MAPVTPDTDKWYATLVRGRVYYLHDTRFEYGKPKEISPEDKEWLENNAFDQVTIKDGDKIIGEDRLKFTFRQGVAEPDTPAVSRRRRPAA